MKALGRPRKLDGSKHSEFVGVKFTRTESDKIDEAANKAGLPKSKWIRDTISIALEFENPTAERIIAEDMAKQ